LCRKEFIKPGEETTLRKGSMKRSKMQRGDERNIKEGIKEEGKLSNRAIQCTVENWIT